MIASARTLATACLGATILLATGALPVAAKGRPGPSSSSVTGNDISWPQCGRKYPSGQAFGIVGVNDGLANKVNPCLASELSWAAGSSGATPVPKASLYVNTADPSPAVADWPSDNVDPNGIDVSSLDPHGSCHRQDDLACAWQYGWDRAVQDMLWLGSSAPADASSDPADYWWWLDVETGNTWEIGTDGQANNVADLQGMVAAFTSGGVSATGIPLGGATIVGIYSTALQWTTITGPAGGSGALGSLPDWIPGAQTTSGATSNCKLPAFTGGPVLITQWFGHRFDGDVSCLS